MGTPRIPLTSCRKTAKYPYSPLADNTWMKGDTMWPSKSDETVNKCILILATIRPDPWPCERFPTSTRPSETAARLNTYTSRVFPSCRTNPLFSETNTIFTSLFEGVSVTRQNLTP